MTQCNNGCGIELHFDGNVRSSSGKMIPLEPNGEKHNCPKRQNTFERNKQMYSSAYAGPVANINQMEKDLAKLGTEVDGLLLRVKELEGEANRFIELSDAIAKELKIKSFKTGTQLLPDAIKEAVDADETINESTN